MERYTEKINETDYKLIKYNDIIRACARHKLGKIEDMLKAFNIETLEELEKLLEFATIYEELINKLGCPLDVVIRAVRDGVYYEDVANRMQYLPVDFHFSLDGDFLLYCNEDEYLLVKNYKKTWWLRKDKSE